VAGIFSPKTGTSPRTTTRSPFGVATARTREYASLIAHLDHLLCTQIESTPHNAASHTMNLFGSIDLSIRTSENRGTVQTHAFVVAGGVLVYGIYLLIYCISAKRNSEESIPKKPSLLGDFPMAICNTCIPICNSNF